MTRRPDVCVAFRVYCVSACNPRSLHVTVLCEGCNLQSEHTFSLVMVPSMPLCRGRHLRCVSRQSILLLFPQFSRLCFSSIVVLIYRHFTFLPSQRPCNYVAFPFPAVGAAH